MTTRFEVYIRENLVDAAGDGLLKDIEDLNIPGAKSARFIKVTEVEGRIGKKEAEKIGAELLADPVSEEFVTGKASGELTKGAWVIEVRYKPGVTDQVADSTRKGIADLGITTATAAHTASRIVLRGKLSRAEVDTISQKLLANSVIQNYSIEKN